MRSRSRRRCRVCPGQSAAGARAGAGGWDAAPVAQRQVPTSGGNPTADDAQADAEHQAARAKYEVQPKSEQAACLREADQRYDRALADETPGE